MSEAAGEQFGPGIKITLPNQEKKIIHPYQELKEHLGPQRYDAVIVFGEGPVKKVIFSDELNEEQKKQWDEFKANPRAQKEPNFRVIDYKKHGLTPDAKNREQLRENLEQMGRFSYKRYGELNALAAGLALYTGKTEKIILSGGRTILEDKIRQGVGFPSEAELMRDLIIKIYGRKLYERDYPGEKPTVTFEEYKKTKLINYFIIEDSATNTIDNIIRSINHAANVFFNENATPEIGLLGNDHQVERTVQLLKLFTGNEKGAHQISAQRDILMPFADFRNKSGNKGFFPELLRYMTDEPTNIDMQERIKGEKIGQEKLKKPEDIFWWLGYVGHSNVPQVFQAIMDRLKQPQWQPYAKKGFDLLELDFEHFSKVSFAQKPNEMAQLKSGFEKILAHGGVLRQQKLVI